MSVGAQALAVARREWAVERAGREATVTVLPVVAAFVVLAGLAFGPAPQQLLNVAGGTIWLAVLVGAVTVSWSVAGAEVAEDAWDCLRGLTAPGALFLGKMLAVWLFLLATWGVAAGLVTVLFDVRLPAAAAIGAIAGTLALAGLTTTLGVLVASGARRRGLLAALIFPAGLPALLAGTELATPAVPPVPWSVMMVVYAAMVVTVSWAVFPAMLEE